MPIYIVVVFTVSTRRDSINSMLISVYIFMIYFIF